MSDSFYTLGIESSCDETAVAIYSQQHGLLAHQLHSQVEIHALYGGVVPELASRDHIVRIIPLIKAALKEANITIKQINSIGYTAGPGLAGALLVGSSVAKSLAYGLNIPALAVHHMEGHLLAPFLEKNKPTFPFICLLVSGGHTMLIKTSKLGCYELLGESLDDAAGEAFDKTAKILGLGYPGGASLATLAKEVTQSPFEFPRPMLHHNNLDFSFSGLKTFARNTFIAHPNQKAEIAFSFEQAATDVLVFKTKKALLKENLSTLIVAGGVSANTTLRNKMNTMCEKHKIKAFYPKLEFCTDNGAMIALAAHLRLINSECDNHKRIDIKPRWPLSDLLPLNNRSNDETTIKAL